MVGGVRVQPPAAGHLAQLDAAVLAFQLIPQLHERAFRLARLYLQHVGQRDGAHRLVRDEQHGFDRALQLVVLQALEHGSYPSSTEVSESSPVSTSSPDPSM